MQWVAQRSWGQPITAEKSSCACGKKGSVNFFVSAHQSLHMPTIRSGRSHDLHDRGWLVLSDVGQNPRTGQCRATTFHQSISPNGSSSILLVLWFRDGWDALGQEKPFPFMARVLGGTRKYPSQSVPTVPNPHRTAIVALRNPSHNPSHLLIYPSLNRKPLVIVVSWSAQRDASENALPVPTIHPIRSITTLLHGARKCLPTARILTARPRKLDPAIV